MERKFFATTVLCLIMFFVITQGAKAQEWNKISGPWLWMIAATEKEGGATSIEDDSLDFASKGAVTEGMIAQNGTNEGDSVGSYQWLPGFIDVDPPNFRDVLFGDGNINKIIGELYNVGDLDDHTSYALITIHSDIAQSGQIGISSDDAFKIWLNGVVVGSNAVNRSADAKNFQDEFDINLKEGPNLLMVKVSERSRKWAMYVGLAVSDSAPIRLEQTQRSPLSVKTSNLEIETTIGIENSVGGHIYFNTETLPRLSPGQPFTLFADIQGTGQFTTTIVKFLRETDELRAFQEAELGYTDYVHIVDHEGEDHTITPEKPHAHTTAPASPGSYSYSVEVEGLDAAGNQIDARFEMVITVKAPQVDLVIESIEARSAAGVPIDKVSIDDKDFHIHVTVKNQGTAPAATATLRYYRSANETLSKGDTELLSDTDGAAHHQIPSLAPGETVSLSLDVEVRRSAGNQYFGAYVDASGIDGRIDNNWSKVIKLLVYGEPSLEISDALISQVAFGAHFTYFVLKANFPTVIDSAGYTIGDCIVDLDLPDVPTQPNRDLASNPGYFMYPLETPEHQIGVVQEAQRAQNRKIATVTLGSAAALVLALAAPHILAAIGIQAAAAGTTAAKLNVAFAISKGTVALGYVIKTTTDSDIPEEAAILTTTADPTLIFRPFIPTERLSLWNAFLDQVLPESLYSTTHVSDSAIDVLFLVKSSKVRQNLGITIAQTYKPHNSDEQKAAIYRGIWNLEETWHRENPGAAAPAARPLSLADYPPFQQLAPAVQEYLLRQFGESVSTREATEWQIPEVTSLLPNYPNPFNPETWLPYQLSEPADVTLTIYDIQGRVVRALDLGHQRAGMYHSRSRAAHWDGRNAVGEPVASGLYFYTLKAGDFAATRKMLIRK